MANKTPKFDGPIPGENYTSDTKNYPWHRPPEEANFVRIVDKAIKKLSTPEKIGQMLTALESGDTILDYVSGTARVTVGNGRIPIDMAVLAAGPIAKFVETVATQAGIQFERGWEQEPRILTKERVDAYRSRDVRKVDTEPELTPEDNMKEVPEERGGLMGPKNAAVSEDEQMNMLGYGE